MNSCPEIEQAFAALSEWQASGCLPAEAPKAEVFQCIIELHDRLESERTHELTDWIKTK